MKCPTCVAEGKKSRVEIGRTSRTCLGHSPFYDEDGKYHNHDPNRSTTQYHCSNGHAWQDVSYTECWCGYGKKCDANLKDGFKQ